jgi:glutaredoxin 3
MSSITLYTTPTCGYCVSAKRLLSERGFGYTEVDVAADPQLRRQISAANGNYPTVPMIFVGDQFVGGYDELAALDRRGELIGLVAKPGVPPVNEER